MLLTNEQSQAMQTFDKKFGWSYRLVFVGFSIGGFILTVLGRQIDALIMLETGVVLMALAGIYSVLAVLRFRAKTGLIWHFMNTHSALYASMLGTVWLLLFLFPSWLAMSSSATTTVLIVLWVSSVTVLYRCAESFSRLRAQLERESFGDQWVTLRQLSFKDLLLLRIPNTRAQLGVTR